ncbi:hypothetical protein OCHUTO_0634 [Orientia chuto str. Dubai]|uniref:Uncharacterized protein n=1 Tax=Orientia chuto str. Dubai TaxID=1359168 RepID=A0A0F3MN25_9RICK|nr:hypothetical protein [Candidatus Orientia mediorientalis]KJV56009.1 hypothetical protein OCHUTO_0634 [Orientia chuto str. Dubai]
MMKVKQSAQIAKALLLSNGAICKHIRDYEKEKNLKPKNGGSSSKLTESQKARIKAT